MYIIISSPGVVVSIVVDVVLVVVFVAVNVIAFADHIRSSSSIMRSVEGGEGGGGSKILTLPHKRGRGVKVNNPSIMIMH